MSLAHYASFLGRMGHRVIQTQSTWWYDVSPQAYRVYRNIPFHRPVTPSQEEIDEVLGFRGIAARYSCPLEAGHHSYYYTCEDKNYDLANLSANERSKIRRGLKRCEIRRIEFKELTKLGALELNRDTLRRQGRTPSRQDEDYRRRFYEVAQDCPIAEVWCAFVDDQLSAYLVGFTIEDCAVIMHMRSNPDSLKAYPNNALVFSFTHEAISRPYIAEVSFGVESIKASLDSLHHFKSTIGFKGKPIGQRIELHRFIRPLITPTMVRQLIRWAEAMGEREQYKKLAGMLHWLQDQHELDRTGK